MVVPIFVKSFDAHTSGFSLFVFPSFIVIQIFFLEEFSLIIWPAGSPNLNELSRDSGFVSSWSNLELT